MPTTNRKWPNPFPRRSRPTVVSVLEAHEFEPGCSCLADHGCTNTAEVQVRIHGSCIPGGEVVLMCRGCVSECQKIIAAEILLQALRGRRFLCLKCGHVAWKVSDVLWGVEAL